MNEMQIFDYNGKTVRTVEINGEPWFIFKDVCEILGITKSRDAASRLDEDERRPVRVDAPNGALTMTAVSESGLYDTILRSSKPEAKPFRKHVTSVILPTIRKTGGYVADEDKFTEHYLQGYPQEVKNLFKVTLKSMDYLNGEVKRLNQEVDGLNTNVKCLTEEAVAKDKVIAQQSNEIEQAKPKVEFYDTVADTKENISVSKYAKLLYKDGVKIGQNRLFKWFRDNGYLRPNNEPYQQYIEAGYFFLHEYTFYIKGVPSIGTKTLITGKGQQYFLKKIKQWFAENPEQAE